MTKNFPLTLYHILTNITSNLFIFLKLNQDLIYL